MVSRQLRPERSLHVEVLAQPVDVHVVETRSEFGDGLVEANEVARKAQKALMMIAEDGFLIEQAVQSEIDIGFDGAARFVRHFPDHRGIIRRGII